MIIFIICHHFKVYQGLYILKMRLLGDGVLTGFLRLISIELSQKPHKDTSFVRSIRNSRKRRGGKMEAYSHRLIFCQILVGGGEIFLFLTQKVLIFVLFTPQKCNFFLIIVQFFTIFSQKSANLEKKFSHKSENLDN